VKLVLALVLAAFLGGDDVATQAKRALGHTFYAVEQIEPARPGLFAPATSTGYFDPAHGRAHWRVTSNGKLVSETVVDGAQVKRYDAADNMLTVAGSCRAFASGCADVLDPVELYRRGLASAAAPDVQPAGADWRLTLRGVAGVEQLVTVDGGTYLPKLIEWRENGTPVSSVRITTLEPRETVDRDAFRLDAHPGAHVRLVTATGAPVRVLSQRKTTVPRGAYWLGRAYQGSPARAVEVRTTAGRALRIAYGPFVVWNYDDYLPTEVVAGSTGFAKTFTLPQGGVARSYFNSSGLVVADVEIGGRRVAVVSAGKVDVFEAARALRRHP
jgi:hypothetical protein